MEKIGVIRDKKGNDFSVTVSRWDADAFNGKVYDVWVDGPYPTRSATSLKSTLTEAAELGTLVLSDEFRKRHPRIARKWNERLCTAEWAHRLFLDSTCKSVKRVGYYLDPEGFLVEIFICKFAGTSKERYEILSSDNRGPDIPEQPSFLDALMQLPSIRGFEWDRLFLKNYWRKVKKALLFKYKELKKGAADEDLQSGNCND